MSRRSKAKHQPVVIRPYDRKHKRGFHCQPSIGTLMVGFFMVCMTLNFMAQTATSYHIANGTHGYGKSRPVEAIAPREIEVAAAQPKPRYTPSSPEWWGLESCGLDKACLERFNAASGKKRK